MSVNVSCSLVNFIRLVPIVVVVCLIRIYKINNKYFITIWDGIKITAFEECASITVKVVSPIT